MQRESIHFVTGRLAAESLRELLDDAAPRLNIDVSIDVLGISVAALLTCAWVAPRLRPPQQATRVVLPGYCQGDLELVRQACGLPVVRGPQDLRDLPGFLGLGPAEPPELNNFTTEILAEINHAPRMPLVDLLAQASALRAAGADVIDLGCDPAAPWSGVAEAVRALRSEGHRVSIDSFEPSEVAAAVRAGAELVLSVNSTNRHAAPDWGCEVVALGDTPADWASLADTVDWLGDRQVRYRIDPILEPIGFNFGASLLRFAAARRQWPTAELMMGVGNLSELTDVDSAGVNVLLLALCEEWGVRSVLTTQVINWCRTAVRECDLARRLAHFAVSRHRLPKHVEPGLVQLRDVRVWPATTAECARLAAQIRDPNYRLLLGQDHLHVVSAGLHLKGDEPYALWAKLLAARSRPLSPEHAFYLGFEMAKAFTALALGKQYRQDEALDWGHLTRPEAKHGLMRDAAPPDTDTTSGDA